MHLQARMLSSISSDAESVKVEEIKEDEDLSNSEFYSNPSGNSYEDGFVGDCTALNFKYRHQCEPSIPITSNSIVEDIHPDQVYFEEVVEETILSRDSLSGTDVNSINSEGRMDPSGKFSGDSRSSFSHSSDVSRSSAGSDSSGIHGYTTITSLDNFARSRLINYIQRYRRERKGDAGTDIGSSTKREQEQLFSISREPIEVHFPRKKSASSNLVFETEESTSRLVYRAKVTIPLPSPHSSYVAEGVSDTSEKDAECLAAMHAERILDALGVPIYRLQSMQQKHAENVRKQGRFAPMPGDSIKPEGTEVPTWPLRMISSIPAYFQREHQRDDSSLSQGEEVVFSFGGAVREAEMVNIDIDKNTSVSSGDHFRTIKNPLPLSPQNEKVQEPQQATSAACSHNETNNGTNPSGDEEEVTVYPADNLYKTFHYPWCDGVVVNDTPDPTELGTGATPNTVHARSQSLGKGLSQAAAASSFDPTENNTFQMTNITSNRISSSTDSICLAAILDKRSYNRIKEWLQVTQGIFDFVKSRVTVTQVSVPGFASRMYNVTLQLTPSDVESGVDRTTGTLPLIARGKAVEKDMALHLACMHAELLIDATGRRLFPTNPQKQDKHSSEVKGFGRWATSFNGNGDMGPQETAPLHAPVVSSVPCAKLPLPLKQQLNVDDVWLDASQSKSLRTDDERILAAHNEINFTVYDFIEVNPDVEQLSEATQLIQRWQKEIAKQIVKGEDNATSTTRDRNYGCFSNLFIITQMGDFFRASCVLPVPKQFGTRGGNAVGRSIEQAIGLCSLHCIEVLCSLNIPVCRNPTEQAKLMQSRAKAGLRTQSPLWLKHNEKKFIKEDKDTKYMYETCNGSNCNLEEIDDENISCLYNNMIYFDPNDPFHIPKPTITKRYDGVVKVGRLYTPYCPGYLIVDTPGGGGTGEKPLPPFWDLELVMELAKRYDGNIHYACNINKGLTIEHQISQASSLLTSKVDPNIVTAKSTSTIPTTDHHLSILKLPSFQLPIHQKADKDILDMGNDARMNVQMYIKRTTQEFGKDPVPNIFVTGYSRGSSVFNVAYIPLFIDEKKVRAVVIEAQACKIVKEMCEGSSAVGDASTLKSIAIDQATTLMSKMTTEEFQSIYSIPTSQCTSDHFKSENDKQKDQTDEGNASSSRVKSLFSSPSYHSPSFNRHGYVRIIAAGSSMKKADAVRCCFLHAAEVLRTFGIDHCLEKSLFITAKKSIKKSATNITPSATSPIVGSSKGALFTRPLRPKPTSTPISPIKRLTPVTATAAAALSRAVSEPHLRQGEIPTRDQVHTITTTTSTTSSNSNSNLPSGSNISTESLLDADIISDTSDVTKENVERDNSGQTSCQLHPSLLSDMPSITPSVLLQCYTEVVPRPFIHPTMHTFFANAKLDKAAYKRNQSSNKHSVF